jgi:hypothetical protein
MPFPGRLPDRELTPGRRPCRSLGRILGTCFAVSQNCAARGQEHAWRLRRDASAKGDPATTALAPGLATLATARERGHATRCRHARLGRAASVAVRRMRAPASAAKRQRREADHSRLLPRELALAAGTWQRVTPRSRAVRGPPQPGMRWQRRPRSRLGCVGRFRRHVRSAGRARRAAAR